ncbi:MATE family efflux transporter [Metamycoplasma canadense]|uniref:Probable multidrug resistance protein NorM n=1 Tax=Metamycoplasma canadense TaxID=29554 RepID=A0A077L6G6_9BACT|nr:MATE family efflux transporter [Metamycoplasma canadense]BAP39401.1 hypothetical protein MCAN360_0142 [Metamycoplasma canadense]
MNKEITLKQENFNFKLELKQLFKLCFPIFVQTLFFAIITIVGSLATSFYNRVYHLDGSYNGYYFYIFAKVFSVYKIITFLPLMYQLGVLVVAANLYGQKKLEELPKLLWSTFYISVIINLGAYLIIFFSSPKLLELAGAKKSFVIGWKNINDFNAFKNNLKTSNLDINQIYNLPLSHYIFQGGFYEGNYYLKTNPLILINNEYEFTIKFLRVGTLDVFITSFAFILTSILQAVKKNKLAIIGVISGSIFRTIWIFLILFVFNKPFLATLEITLGSAINLLISFILVKKYAIKNNNINFKQTWNNKYIKEVLKIGFPISLETGIWFIAQYLLTKAIPDSKLDDSFIGLWRAVNNVYDLFAAFLFALSYVTSSVIATEIGKKEYYRAKRIGNLSFKLGMSTQIIFALLGVALTYPLFKIYSIDTDLINKYCYFLMPIFMVKTLADVGPLTTLRSLWGVNDVWMPNLISLLTMIGLQTSLVYILILFKNPNLSQELFLISLAGIALIDPTIRSILYLLRWNSEVWHKYAKTL